MTVGIGACAHSRSRCEGPIVGVVEQVESFDAHDCLEAFPDLCRLLQPRITPRIVEASYSCSVQFAYAAADEGLAITTASMARCTFPDVVPLPFVETLPELHLGLDHMESNESPSLKIYRKVVPENLHAHLQAGNLLNREVTVAVRAKSNLSFPVVSKSA